MLPLLAKSFDSVFIFFLFFQIGLRPVVEEFAVEMYFATYLSNSSEGGQVIWSHGELYILSLSLSPI